MEKQKYTPGPWRISNGELEYGQFDILTERGGFPNVGIATVVDGRFSDVDRGSVALHRGECLANARLIAAAPELLEAVKAGVIMLRELNEGHANRTIETMNEIIAKAEGEDDV